MKKITLGIIIGIAISLSSITFASSAIKLIMVPEYTNGYKTLDLLDYVSTLKARQDAIDQAQLNSKANFKKLPKGIMSA